MGQVERQGVEVGEEKSSAGSSGDTIMDPMGLARSSGA